MKKILYIGLILLLIVSCAGFSSAEMTQRTRMIHDATGSTSSQDMTHLQQDLEKQMAQYSWADPLMDDFLAGKTNTIAGFTDNIPPEGAESLPRPEPDVSLSPYHSEVGLYNLQMDREVETAGYQLFGGSDRPNYCGRVSGKFSNVANLVDNCNEWFVMHQWGKKYYWWGSTQTENCIVTFRSGYWGIYRIFVSSLGGYDVADPIYIPADHIVYLAIRPEHSGGSRSYDRVTFTINDLTDGTTRTLSYALPETEQIYNVDAALETYDVRSNANGQWKSFYDYRAMDQNINYVNLLNNFKWTEYPSSVMNHEHDQWYDNYGGTNARATLWQRNTQK